MFSLGLGWLLFDFWLGIRAGFYWLGIAIPISGTFSVDDHRRRRGLGAITIVIGLIPVVGTVLSITGDTIQPVIESIRYFAFALLAFQFGSNLLLARPAQN